VEIAPKDRFVIALAKFFGEGPVRDRVPTLQICSKDLLNEILTTLVVHDEIHLNLEQFNRLMVCFGHRLASDHFFQYFFKQVKTIDEFERAVDKYRTKAMWLFGNFRFAYRQLATTDEPAFRKLIQQTEPIPETTFSSREPFTEIEQIPVENLYLLGYIAKSEWEDLELAHSAIHQLASPGADKSKILEGVGSEKLLAVLQKHGVIGVGETLDNLKEDRLQSLGKKTTDVVEPFRAARNAAVLIGERNTDRYLTTPHLDVYVATSMRDKEDFRAQHEFTMKLFSDPQVEPLRLRYFDPTLSYVDDRITKGLIEMLMLRRAAVTIYVAGATDTLGKDSELAATLAQGKPVIVYVPKGEISLPCGTVGCHRKVNYDKRAENFREDHPLGLQIAVKTGVAHGIMVVRSPEECARVLRKVMLHEREFTIEHEKGVFLLRETESKSVVRVVSDSPLLTHAFWTYFNENNE